MRKKKIKVKKGGQKKKMYAFVHLQRYSELKDVYYSAFQLIEVTNRNVKELKLPDGCVSFSFFDARTKEFSIKGQSPVYRINSVSNVSKSYPGNLSDDMKTVERDPRAKNLQSYEPGTHEFLFTLFNFEDTEKAVIIKRYFSNKKPPYLPLIDIPDGCSSYYLFNAMVKVSDTSSLSIKITKILGTPDIHYLDPDADINEIRSRRKITQSFLTYKNYHL
jgi:hypothetical protein